VSDVIQQVLAVDPASNQLTMADVRAFVRRAGMVDVPDAAVVLNGNAEFVSYDGSGSGLVVRWETE
jgi:hypothetical protein